MSKVSPSLTITAFFAVLLAFLVIVLGAYTRATDAGLGCPDWPGCYNRLVAPDNSQQVVQAEKAFPDTTVQVRKAWTEMIHRYAAGTLALLIIVLCIMTIAQRKITGHGLFVPAVLILLLVFQILLGMWTVTLKLAPQVVMGHLLGGMSILSLLWWMFLRSRSQANYQYRLSSLKIFSIIGLIIVFCQIALGAWTSSNYAALVCPAFPTCHVGQFFPEMDYRMAFDVFSTAIATHHISQAALITIQMTHRIGGAVTGIYIGLLSIYLIFSARISALKTLGIVMFFVLLLQISLGIINVVWLLPLPAAVLHNAVAAILLLTVVTLNYIVFKQTR